MIQEFLQQSSKIILGKEQALKLSLCCLLAKGHLLIEDIPGVGKTTLAKYLAKAMGLKLSRIQFTSDLLPSDILGTNIFNPQDNTFKFHHGPIFGQVILADELNRATPKTQSALLQVMEEYRVTIDKENFTLPQPFFVMATQNPRDQIGTNDLPESQLDRFLMRLELGHPDEKSEIELLLSDKREKLLSEISPVTSEEELLKAQEKVTNIHTSEKIAKYVVALLNRSRQSSQYSALSPRAGLDLMAAAQAWVFIHGGDDVLPEDIQKVAPAVLNHRISSNQLEASGSYQLVSALIHEVEVF